MAGPNTDMGNDDAGAMVDEGRLDHGGLRIVRTLSRPSLLLIHFMHLKKT